MDYFKIPYSRIVGIDTILYEWKRACIEDWSGSRHEIFDLQNQADIITMNLIINDELYYVAVQSGSNTNSRIMWRTENGTKLHAYLLSHLQLCQFKDFFFRNYNNKK